MNEREIYYFNGMDESSELKNIREALARLEATVKEQGEELVQLRQEIKNRVPVREQRAKFLGERVPSDVNLENFIGLRLIHLVGIVVLVIGLSIGVKYAIDRDLISETLRISLAYGAGLILFILSVRLKKNYTFFSAILFSGSMASLYFTTYAGFVYYALFSFPLAFGIMILLTLFTVYQAMAYKREEIAILGMVGAYAIPFLVSTNAERVDLLFLYIALINAGVGWLVLRKEWKLSGRIAQAITWVLLLGWVSMRFTPSMQQIAIGFIAYFFLLFTFIVAGQTILYRKTLTVNDVYQQVLNNIALYLSALFISGDNGYRPDAGMITLVITLLVFLQAILAHYILREELAKRMLATLAFMFFVLFIGLQWNGVTVTMLWLLSAVIVFTIGYRYRSVGARMAGITLMGVTLGKLLLVDSMRFSPGQKIVSYIVLGILLLVISFFYQKFKENIFKE